MLTLIHFVFCSNTKLCSIRPQARVQGGAKRPGPPPLEIEKQKKKKKKKGPPPYEFLDTRLSLVVYFSRTFFSCSLFWC